MFTKFSPWPSAKIFVIFRNQVSLAAIFKGPQLYNRGNSLPVSPLTLQMWSRVSGELNSPCARYYFLNVISRARAKRCPAEAPHFVWKRQMSAATLLCGGLPLGNRKLSDQRERTEKSMQYFSLRFLHFTHFVRFGRNDRIGSINPWRCELFLPYL